ncbi:MAG: ABC transporter permease [Verrucomicrobiales bacterium]
MTLSPLTRKKFNRFRAIKRGWWSFVILGVFYSLSLVAELLVNNRAIVVKYEGEWYFPTYGAFHPGIDFGETYNYEANYRALREKFRQENRGNWVLMPPVPYGPQENDFLQGKNPPSPPDFGHQHYFGTDPTGRDVLARVVYGFRIGMTFALAFTVAVYLIGVVIGCAMGYFGGWVDLLGQRLVEIWSNIPFLYMVIIAVSLTPAEVGTVARVALLLIVMVAFSWSDKTYYMRTVTYKEKARDYTAAAQLLGAGPFRILFRHIFPNTVATLVTFLPFTVAGAISLLTALDFLNFGLPKPTPSWGELLEIGLGHTHAPWIVTSAVLAIFLVLLLVTFVGEAVREAFDPRKFTTYR